MRAILGAPRWTRLEDLRMQSNRSSLRLRIQQITSVYTTKSLSSAQTLPFKQRTEALLARPDDTNLSSGWQSLVANAIKITGVSYQHAHRRPTPPHPLYTAEPPWKPPIFQSNILKPQEKASCKETLRRFANQINSKASEDQIAIFTDGSVIPDTGHSRAAVRCSTRTSAWSLPNYCSTLQAELFSVYFSTNPRVTI